MSEHALIDAYLTGLRAELRLPARTRARILDEAADHLLCATEHRRAAGMPATDAQRAAIGDFGPAAVVALAHERATAVHAARRLAPAVATAVLVFAAVVAALTQDAPGGIAAGVAVLAVQVAAVCGGLTVLRAWGARRDAAAPAGTLRLLGRGAGVALAAVATGVGAAAIGVVRDGGPTSLVVLLGVSGVGTIAAAVLTGTAARRTAALARRVDEPAAGDPAAQLLGHRPWRVAGATALAAGLVAAAGHLVAEGPPTDGAGPLLAVSAVLIALEGGAVLVCFALLGGVLGLRSGPAGRGRVIQDRAGR